MNQTSPSIFRLIVGAAVIAIAGCGEHSAPFKFNADGDLAHYNKVATDIEAPNISNCPCDASMACQSPDLIGPESNPEYLDLKLEGAMQMALGRNKVLQDLGGAVLRQPGNARTIHGPAITDTDPRYGVEAALSEFDAVFSSRVDYQRNDRLLNNVFFGGGTRNLLQDIDTFQSQLSKARLPAGSFRSATTRRTTTIIRQAICFPAPGIRTSSYSSASRCCRARERNITASPDPTARPAI